MDKLDIDRLDKRLVIPPGARLFNDIAAMEKS